MSQKSNKKSESVIKANSTKKTGTKNESQIQSNILPFTHKNLHVFNLLNNNSSSQSYNTPTSNSSVGNNSDDDAKTVVMDEHYGPQETSGMLNKKITYVNSTPTNDKNDKIYSSPPATELLTRDGTKMYYIINDKMEAVTNDNYNRDNPVYDEFGNEIPRGEHLPEKRIFMNDIMDESTGGKKSARLIAKPIAKPFVKQSERKRAVIDADIPENINNNSKSI